MKIISTEKRLCQCCMEEHEVRRVLIKEDSIFKGMPVEYNAEYFYCDRGDEFYSDENMISANDISMKNAYRRAKGLLTTDEIIAIRAKYKITQSDLCLMLGWGGKTIARYESHQVQDRAYDMILRKLREDPEWFLTLLEASRDSFSKEAYGKYHRTGARLYEQAHDTYLERTIYSQYTCYMGNPEFTGDKSLSLEMVVDVVRYYANSSQVTNLYQMKLMRLLWYADALSYKRRRHAITGMVYRALPMGALPIAHESIPDLSNILCEEIETGDGTAYRFLPTEDKEYPHLTNEDRAILDVVIRRFGKASKDEIAGILYQEEAYRNTASGDIIPFPYAQDLSLS